MADLSKVAIFADSGVTAHQVQYRSVGEAIAKRRGHLVCLSEKGDWPQGLIESALAHGGAVTLVVPGSDVPDVPRGVTIEQTADLRAAAHRAAELSQALIGLPCGIDMTAALYGAWVDVGGAASGKPIGLLNSNNAFEIVRGFMTDVAAVGRGNIDHIAQVSDNFDDLWVRLGRLVEQA